MVLFTTYLEASIDQRIQISLSCVELGSRLFEAAYKFSMLQCYGIKKPWVQVL